MKNKFCLSALVLSFAALSTGPGMALAAPASSAACATNPPAAQFVIASLSLIRAGFQPIEGALGGGENATAIEDELCAQLTGLALAPSKSKSGYTNVTLTFTHETCTESLLLTADGRVADTDGDIDCR